MKVIVITDTASTGNIIKGAFKQAKVSDIETVIVSDSSSVEEHAQNCESVIVLDWDSGESEVNSEIVKSAHTACPDVPILLLASKQSSSNTFAGMKNGAKGVINKPIEPESFLKAIAGAMKSHHKKGPAINVEFINPFIEATKNVFKTMVGIEVEREKLYLKEDHKMYGDISGVMGLSGSATGSVVISMNTSLALQAVASMLGEEVMEEITPETCDAVGELINMISGQAKASLTKTKYHFQISIPTVVQGHGHEVTHKKGTPNIVVLFKADNGESFAIQVCLSPVEQE
ncbi:MAG: chemotaxis protein CheX [Planctomycetota bacterium]|jgi:chemotaxis protein CheX